MPETGGTEFLATGQTRTTTGCGGSKTSPQGGRHATTKRSHPPPSVYEHEDRNCLSNVTASRSRLALAFLGAIGTTQGAILLSLLSHDQIVPRCVSTPAEPDRKVERVAGGEHPSTRSAIRIAGNTALAATTRNARIRRSLDGAIRGYPPNGLGEINQ